jgi:hypothetical protein
MLCFPIYPINSLNSIKKGNKLRSELSQAILQLLATDEEVKKLIRDKLAVKFNDLVDRC